MLRGGPHGSSSAGDEPDAVPMVLVHGGGLDNAGISWFEVFEVLARSRPVTALDLPGFGYTEGLPVNGSPGDMADLVVSVVGGVPAVWVGVSMGGDVVLNVALRHPDAVAGLVLVAPGGLAARAGNRVLHPAAWLATRLPDPVLRPAMRWANRLIGVAIRSMVHDPRTVPPAVREEMVREARRPDAGLGYARYNQATVGPWGMLNDLTERVGEIRAPALFVHGRDDGLVDPRNSIRAAATMRNARLVLLDSCGHWAQIERRDRFLTEVEVFLRRIAPKILSDDEPDPDPET